MVVDYTLVRSRRRSLELRVFPDRRVEVRAPLKTAQREIDAFVASRHGWLERMLAKMSERPAPLLVEYQHGARHPFLGEPIKLSLSQNDKRSMERQSDVLLLCQPDLSPLAVAESLERWYREQARVLFEQEIDRRFPFFAGRGHRRPTLRIKQMKTRWGSLSARGYINLNLALVYYPRACLEYVVVHELCHLEHMDHGPGFRALMTELMPDWATRRTLLNRLPSVSAPDHDGGGR